MELDSLSPSLSNGTRGTSEREILNVESWTSVDTKNCVSVFFTFEELFSEYDLFLKIYKSIQLMLPNTHLLPLGLVISEVSRISKNPRGSSKTKIVFKVK